MHKKSIVLLVVVFISFHTSSAIRTFVINETGRISLDTIVSDPDNDLVDIRYTFPIDYEGEWQTDYGDAGEYSVTITVSDGVSTTIEDVLVIVKRKEEPPQIVSSIPERTQIVINENDAIKFEVEAKDLNDDRLSYRWLLDNKKVSENKNFVYTPSYNDSGRHSISIAISDSELETVRQWDVLVNDVNLDDIINSINNVVVNENEIARLELPDFEKYDLRYEISEPLGNKNFWKTDYSSAGIYNVTLKVTGRDFSAERILSVIVRNFDRHPVFKDPGVQFISEGNKLQIELNAEDPDGDEVEFFARNLPEGSELNENTFTWTPDFDAVKRENILDSLFDKFRILEKTFAVEFIAESHDNSVVRNVPIVVWDANRRPTLKEIEAITVSEGDIVDIEPEYNDPDGDKVRISFSGWMGSNKYRTNFNDQGVHYVKVTASDGILEDSKYAKINVLNVNREPDFKPISRQTVLENETLEIRLAATDKDNDKLEFTINNPPKGSELHENIFTWTPSYEFTSDLESVELEFEVSDGTSKSGQTAVIEVKNRNRAPEIVTASPADMDDIKAAAGKPIILEISAVDEDNDELTYTWNFGFLEEYKLGAKHKRIFSSKGNKKVKVTVSDGKDEVEHVWNITVV